MQDQMVPTGKCHSSYLLWLIFNRLVLRWVGQDMNRIINSMIFRNIAPKPTLKNNTLLSGKAK